MLYVAGLLKLLRPLLVLGLIWLLGGSAFAAKDRGIMSFKSWKAYQVRAAEDRLAEAIAGRSYVKSRKKGDSAISHSSRSSRLKKYSADQMHKSVMNGAKSSLDYANNLSLSDYCEIYFSQLKLNRKSIKKAIKRSTPEEMAELLQCLQKSIKESDRVSNSGKAIKDSQYASMLSGE